MARTGRFTEARIYVAGGSVALLLGIWGLLAAQDAHSRDEMAEATAATGSIDVPVTDNASPGGAQAPTAPRLVQPTPKPHSRTHGS
jgi:hypothetical protein